MGLIVIAIREQNAHTHTYKDVHTKNKTKKRHQKKYNTKKLKDKKREERGGKKRGGGKVEEKGEEGIDMNVCSLSSPAKRQTKQTTPLTIYS